MNQLAGLHHVSAITAGITDTHEFYTRLLGMRPVIRTVNQDDPSMYHLFYGDGAGSVGSDMTMFDIPHAVRERRGNNSITRTSLRVGSISALVYWADRLRAAGVVHGGVRVRDDRSILDFDDAGGTPLSLIDDGSGVAPHPWTDSPVPAENQVIGLGPVTITVPVLEPTDRFLTTGLGLRHDRTYRLEEDARFGVHVYAMGDGGPAAEVHVVVRDDIAQAKYGGGGVHHLALRIPEGQDIRDWIARLDEAGYHNSGLVDRYYFQSVYVREPNHVLFELATDGPGFTVDGPLDGERLSLPPFLEPRRAEIEAGLRPL
jgi:glyoxalase family protein